MRKCLTTALMILFVGAPPAFANSPPGPVGSLAVVLMPLSILFFSSIGGVYSILRHGSPSYICAGLKLAAVLLFLFLSVTPETGQYAATVIGLFVAWRALQMLFWAQQINGSKPELAGANKLRLQLSALGLVLTYVVLFVTRNMLYEWPGDTIRDYIVPATVKSNMRTCQIAVEDYASNNAELYPESVSDKAFRSYFPEGSAGPPFKPGLPPVNPMTKEWHRTGVFTSHIYEGPGTHEWPVAGKITDIRVARQQAPSWVGKGVVEYSVIYGDKHKPVSYAIRGGDANGMAVKGYDKPTLVLSNQ